MQADFKCVYGAQMEILLLQWTDWGTEPEKNLELCEHTLQMHQNII